MADTAHWSAPHSPLSTRNACGLCGDNYGVTRMTGSANGVIYSILMSFHSYWSIGDGKNSAGGILLDPRRAADTRPWYPNYGYNLFSALRSGMFLSVTIMHRIGLRKGKSFFICLLAVANPQNYPLQLERFGGTRTGRPESAQLGRFPSLLGIEDAK